MDERPEVMPTLVICYPDDYETACAVLGVEPDRSQMWWLADEPEEWG